MPGHFVSCATAMIGLDGDENFITIKTKMGIGDDTRADDALLVPDENGERQVRLGNYRMALLEINIVGWGGPDFKDVPLTPANIRLLDPDSPLVKKVITEIEERNQVRKSPDPKLASDESAMGESSAEPMMTGSIPVGTPALAEA